MIFSFDEGMWLRCVSPKTPWHRHDEGMWLSEARAAELLDLGDCGCRGEWRCGPWPRHARMAETSPFNGRELAFPKGVGGPPELRFAWQRRDALGRWKPPGDDSYFWRPDVERFVAWYVEHLAEQSARLLSNGGSEEELAG